jgi:hypothetical protein
MKLNSYHILTFLTGLSMILAEAIALPGPDPPSRAHTPMHCESTHEYSVHLGFCPGDKNSGSIDRPNGNIFTVGDCQRACHCEMDRDKNLWMVCAESVVPFCTGKQLLERCGCADRTNLGGKCWGPCRWALADGPLQMFEGLKVLLREPRLNAGQ